MFDIQIVIRLSGRFDAANAEIAEKKLASVQTSAVVDFSDLTYLSSAALGVLFAAQRRLKESGHELKLVHLNPHIREVFKIAGFDQIFSID